MDVFVPNMVYFHSDCKYMSIHLNLYFIFISIKVRLTEFLSMRKIKTNIYIYIYLYTSIIIKNIADIYFINRKIRVKSTSTHPLIII